MSAEAHPPAWLRKLDHRLRALWERTPHGAAGTGQRVHVFIRFSGDTAGLRTLGVELGSVAGDIATASFPLDDLPKVAGSAQVAFIELSRPLAPDAG